MIRIAAAFGFWLTLLCPVICLADTGRACCDLGQAESQNCEAMSIGAVVADRVIDGTPIALGLPSLDGHLPAESTILPCRWLPLTTWRRVHTKPPPAATRHALLQTFLF
jgi:hypothetical protein